MSLGPTGSLDPLNRVPHDTPQRRHDDNAWRHNGPRRPQISLLHILGALVLMAVVTGAAFFLLDRSTAPGFEARILHPTDGATYEPGRVLVRFRTFETTGWEMQYRLPGEAMWETLASGSGEAIPAPISGNATHFLDAHEPGAYALRLTGHNAEGETVSETIEFTVE